MTKIDHKSNLPKIFQENSLSILPITRGKYIIAPFETHKPIKYQSHSKLQKKSHHLESFKDIISESVALNFAMATGMIEEILGEECTQTISGRMSS